MSKTCNLIVVDPDELTVSRIYEATLTAYSRNYDGENEVVLVDIRSPSCAIVRPARYVLLDTGENHRVARDLIATLVHIKNLRANVIEMALKSFTYPELED